MPPADAELKLVLGSAGASPSHRASTLPTLIVKEPGRNVLIRRQDASEPMRQNDEQY